jgi:chromosome segregation protein
VLDELDAPLDESNINRFIKILKRVLGHSQFIIITHNKPTIGMANVPYEVTMQDLPVILAPFRFSSKRSGDASLESGRRTMARDRGISARRNKAKTTKKEKR